MISTKKATEIVLRHKLKLSSYNISYADSLGRVLDEPIIADRDIPALNRATMDGIAIRYKDYAAGQRIFRIANIQAAGMPPQKINHDSECIHIMTGAGLDKTVNTVVRIEDVTISKNLATITVDNILEGQFVHTKGSDRKQNSLLVRSGRIITPDLLAIMASVGKTSVRVVTPPKLAIITTGNELVDPDKKVNDFQIRRSNDQVARYILHRYSVETELIHVKDDEELIIQQIKNSLKTCDAIITIGGVSKGKYDFVQTALANLGATKHFHGVEQKPGKPLWFGSLHNKPIFGLPGNPVSVYVSMARYVVPWLEASLGIESRPIAEVMLDQDIIINSTLTYFVLVKTYFDDSVRLRATPVVNNNSGDFISMSAADAFVELPAGQSVYAKDSVRRLWPLKDKTIL